MKHIDLSCDVGEVYLGQPNRDAEIMPFLSSCHIACGFHSGDPMRISKTIELAMEHQVAIGAHPSYDDKENFGRISMSVDPAELIEQIRYQIAAVQGMTESLGGHLHHIKPHGALYHDLNTNPALAARFARLVKSFDPELLVYTFSCSELILACIEVGLKFVIEGFGDRVYESASELRSRVHPDAVLHDQTKILNQVNRLLDHQVQLYDGSIVEIEVDTICMHSDTQDAVRNTAAIYHHLTSEDVHITAATGHRL